MAEFEVQVGNQRGAVGRIGFVELVTDFPLPLCRFLEQRNSAGGIVEGRFFNQALAVKQHIELLELIEIPQRLQREVLVGPALLNLVRRAGS